MRTEAELSVVASRTSCGAVQAEIHWALGAAETLTVIVCSCNVLSDRDVRSVLAAHLPRTPGQVYGCLACSPQCGRCAVTIRRIIDEARGDTTS